MKCSPCSLFLLDLRPVLGFYGQSMKHEDLIKYAVKCVAKYSKSCSAQFNSQDWEDISQEVCLHVYSKRKMRNPKLPYRPWVKTVVCNQIRNKIRDRIRILPFKPLITKVIEENDELVYEPDAIMIESKKLTEIVQELTSKEKRLLSLHERYGNWKIVGEKTGLGLRIYSIKEKIKKQVLAAL